MTNLLGEVEFILQINDIFHLRDGNTVFIGPLLAGNKIALPLKVKIVVEQQEPSSVTLHGYRMPGNELPKDYVVVYNKDSIDLPHSTVQNQSCKLVIVNPKT